MGEFAVNRSSSALRLWSACAVLLLVSSACFYEYGDNKVRGPLLPGQGQTPCDMNDDENTCGDLRCHRLYADQFPNAGVCGAPCGPQSQCNDYDNEYGDFSNHQCVAGRCVGPENPGHSDYAEEPDVPDAGPDDDAGVRPVEILTFEADATLVASGTVVTFTVATVNAESCSLEGEDGEVTRNGTFEKTVVDDTTYTLKCLGEGDDNSDEQQVTVNVGDTVRVVSLDVDKPVVTAGDEVSVSFLVINADSCTLSDGTDSETVAPDASPVAWTIQDDTTLTLTCEGLGDDDSETVDVVVALLNSWSLDVQAKPADQTFVASWLAPHTTSCEVTAAGSVVASGDTAVDGTGTADIDLDAGTHVLNLRCSFDDTTDVIEAQQSYTAYAMSIDQFALVEAPPVVPNSTAHFIWETTAVDNCSLFVPGDATPVRSNLATSCTDNSCGEVTLQATSGNHQLVCEKTAGGNTAEVIANVNVDLVVQIETYDLSVGSDDVTLTYNALAATSCSLSGVSMSAPASGTELVMNPGTMGAIDYTLLCTGSGDGNTDTGTLTVWWGDYLDANTSTAVDAIVGNLTLSNASTVLDADIANILEVSGNYSVIGLNVLGFQGEVRTRYVGGSVNFSSNPNLYCAECLEFCGAVQGSLTCDATNGSMATGCPVTYPDDCP